MLAVLAITACYSPSPSPGAPCGPGGLCPAGLRCSAGLCVVDELPADASDPDAPSDSLAPPDVARTRWNLVASAGSLGTSVVITPTQQTHTLLVGIETTAIGSVTGVTDDAGNTYAPIPASRAVNTGINAVEVWIASDIKDGATKVSAAGTAVGAVVVWEVANLSLLAPVVDVGTANTQPSSTTPKGVELALTERGQFMLSLLLVQNVVSGLTAGSAFTNDHTTFGNGWAHLTDDDAPVGSYQATWNQPMSGTSCAVSVVLRVAD